ncbi:MAG: nucleotidyl transferase AbiEii/AbiGii toxin family protein [Elusimicrobia bacterium]|nr:nucleotidyl transferase AbiEii/AbiGii toxin family protein [Elusimicrobiota bacterium]
MQDLIRHEIFEIEVIEYLNKNNILNNLVFVGGTMLRLCYGLDRYSVDLDFWVYKNLNFNLFFEKIKKLLEKKYVIKDCHNKFFSIVFEIRSDEYPSSLKIEIRKEKKKLRMEKNIAYSTHSEKQVLLNSIILDDMMKFKVDAFLNRKEIRDVYDIEFMVKKGINLNITGEKALAIIKNIDNLTKNDYRVKLSTILPEEKRDYYKNSNFKILLSKLQEKLER